MNYLEGILLTLPGIVIGLSFHEFGHALAADKLGDPTPRNQGRLTLSPLAHFDIIGFLFIIFARFGWGKPVQIDYRHYKNLRKDLIIVGIAGITMNILVAFLFAIIFKLLSIYNLSSLLGKTTYINLVSIILFTVQINVYLAVFNLLPIPPLDGFGVFANLFNFRNVNAISFLYKYGTIILMFMIITGVVNYLIIPPANFILTFISRVVGI